jgi:hypothetical protein
MICIRLNRTDSPVANEAAITKITTSVFVGSDWSREGQDKANSWGSTRMSTSGVSDAEELSPFFCYGLGAWTVVEVQHECGDAEDPILLSLIAVEERGRPTFLFMLAKKAGPAELAERLDKLLPRDALPHPVRPRNGLPPRDLQGDEVLPRSGVVLVPLRARDVDLRHVARVGRASVISALSK